MKYIRQFTIILIISFLGEVLKELLPLPVPASIYGVVLMLTALSTGIIKLKAVRDVGHMLTKNMQLMFIPATVGLMVSWNQIREMLIPIVVIISVSTVIVMVVSGKVTEAAIHVREEWDQLFEEYFDNNKNHKKEI